jgi:hypothetical protein
MAELKKLNETAERIAEAEDWRSSDAFSKRERAALAWAEAVTNIQDGHAPEVLCEAVRAQFTDVETVNLTLVITTIDAWNRITIALGTHSGHTYRVRVDGGLFCFVLRKNAKDKTTAAAMRGFFVALRMTTIEGRRTLATEI